MRRAGIIAAMLLSSCATAETEQPIGPYPQDYRTIMNQYVRENFRDPYTVRDASIAAPFQSGIYTLRGWLVCARTNAKNAYGGYIGAKTSGYLIRDGKVLISTDGLSQCEGVQLTPWPEIEEGNPQPFNTGVPQPASPQPIPATPVYEPPTEEAYAPPESLPRSIEPVPSYTAAVAAPGQCSAYQGDPAMALRCELLTGANSGQYVPAEGQGQPLASLMRCHPVREELDRYRACLAKG